MSARHREPAPVILCVTAEEAVRRAIREAFSISGQVVLWKEAVADALEVCASRAPDLILLQTGIKGDARLVAEAARPGTGVRIPLIALGSPAACAKALRAGATDWMTPPLEPALIRQRVQAVMDRVRASAELAALRLRLEEEEGVVADGGSAVALAAFLRRVDAKLAAPRHGGGHAALLAISFETDDATTTGAHLDAALPTLGARLREALRPEDNQEAGPRPSTRALILRSESAEYSVFLEHVERAQDAYKIAQHVQQELERPIEIDGRPRRFQARIGISAHPDDGATGAALRDAAHQVLTRQQTVPRRNILFASASTNSRVMERMTLEGHLHHALERNELKVYYQPRVDIASGRVVSFEALLRWRHPELGMISPGQFIPIAEDTQLIVPIGAWVLHEACRQNQAWRAQGLPPVRIAVNLSSVQFQQPDLEVQIAGVLEETGLDPDGLELELTESLLLHKADATLQTLRTIKDMGIHMSIDDFGTGYSSLSYIKRFPIDALKIDRSFIREVTTSPEDAAITTSIILMGKSLDLTVVAEGVETRSQLEFLRVLECDEAQGYLFSRPVPAEEAATLLSTGSCTSPLQSR